MEEEYGGSLVRFLNPDQVKMYHSVGKEIDIPKCENCGYYKIHVSGTGIEGCLWICGNCVVECEIKKP